MIRNLSLIFICIICPVLLNSQNSFTTKFETTDDEMTWWWIQNTNDEYIGFIGKVNPDTDNYSQYVYRLSQLGDTIISRKFNKLDTNISVNQLIQSNDDPIEYLISGSGHHKDVQPQDYFNYFLKVDENFNTIWERYYYLKPPNTFASYELWQNLLKRKDGGYLFATDYDDAPNSQLVLFHFSEDGDSLQYRNFAADSAGFRLFDVLYNYDSSSYLLLTYRAHYIPFQGLGQCITVDFNFNQTSVEYYPRWFDDGLFGKILPDGSLITGGLYENMEPPGMDHMAVFKHDTDFIQTGYCFIGDPDPEIRKDNGRRSLDFYYPNSIFVAGTYDYDVGIWIPHPSWIIIGKMDSDLNLIKETYIGGDAFYYFRSITATSDGGALIATNRYDYLTQDYEHDVYIIKLDSLDLTVGLIEPNKLSQLISVYPNPAQEHLYIKSNFSNAILFLYNSTGKLVLESSIQYGLNTIGLPEVPSGMYFWQTISSSNQVVKGKVIITK